MKTTRKILLALVLTLAVAAVMSVCAFAFDINTDLPQGVTNESDKWIDSGYTDVDTESGWYLIATNVYDYSTVEGGFPTFASMNGTRFYWNKTTGEAVWLAVSSNLSGDSGEEVVYSVLNPNATAKKRFYAYATHFVDITNDADNDFKTHFAKSSDEKSQSASRNATKYPIHESYINAGDASQQWSSYYVTAEAYADYIAYKAELGYADDAEVTDEAHQKLLVEYAYANIAPYKSLRNCQEDGAAYRMAWIFQQLADNGYVFESIELRAAAGVTPYFGTVGLVSKLIEADTILFDSRIVKLNFTNTTRGLFIGNSALKTLAHVEYTTDDEGNYTGKYSTTVTKGVVDLSGFTTVTTYSEGTYAFSEILYQAGMTDVIWFNSIKDGDTEYAGLLDNQVLYQCKSLKTVTLTAPLTAIDKYAFRGCTALTTIDLKGGVAEGAVIDANAFTDTKQAVTVYVYSAADMARAQTLFASVSNITVVNNSKTDGAITSDGYSIRKNDTNAITAGPALRAEFTLLKSIVDAALTDEGVTLADYGVIVFSANTLDSVYGGDADAVLAALAAGTHDASKIKQVSAANGPYVRVNAAGDITFAAAITGIPEANWTSGVYTYAYAAWTKDDGATLNYTYTTYTSERTGKTAHSLYDATVFAFKSGIVNSQNFVMSTDVELWDILQKGAFSITDGEQKSFASTITPTVKYEFDAEGKFTYLNLPLYAWSFYKSSATAAIEWNSCAYDLEAESSTNVMWSILEDGDELVVVYRRADGIADDAVAALPSLRDRNYGGYAPYSSSYFTPGTQGKGVIEVALEYGNSDTNGFYKYATIHSPILSDANEEKITTLVVDYGVNKFNVDLFENTTVNTLTTIVYPEGVTAGEKVLHYNYYVNNVIYASDNKTSLTAETQVDGFGSIADLSGLSGVNFSYVCSYARAVENVIVPAKIGNTSGLEEAFYNAYKLKRVWAVGTPVPEEGTIDMTAASGLRSFAKRCFTSTSTQAVITAPTIILPASFMGISNYGYKLTEKDACSQIFGKDMSFTVVLNDIKALTATEKDGNDNWSLMAFYDNLQVLLAAGTATADQADNLNKLTFVCDVNGETKSMTITEWRAYLVAQGLYTPAE